LKREQVRLNKEIQAALSLAEKHEAVEERGIEGSIVAE
jgi:hypothetical protein